MKKLSLISLLTVFCFMISYSQQSPKPMSGMAFKSYYKKMQKPKTDEKRVKKGIKLLRNKNISSNQVFKVANLFADDNMRLVYVKEIYPKISDKSNAIIICDAFNRFSHAQILWEFIKQQNKNYGVPEPDLNSYANYLLLKDKRKDKQRDKLTADNTDKNKKTEVSDFDDDDDIIVESTNKHVEKIVEMETAQIKNSISEKTPAEEKKDEKIVENQKEEKKSLVFPSALDYKGAKACDNYLGEKQFLAFANAVAQIEDDQEKVKICMEYSHTYCFTTEQIMKLGIIIKNEAYRFIFFKTAYETVYDRDNFLYVKQLLTEDRFINGINEIYVVPAQKKPNPGNFESNTERACVLNDKDFDNIKSAIRSKYSSSEKLDLAKVKITEAKCISAAQIKEILSLLFMENDKIEFAKYAYNYCSDKQNYSIVRNFFTSQESRNEIDEFLKNK